MRKKGLILLLAGFLFPGVFIWAQSGDGNEPEFKTWTIKERQDTEEPWEKTKETTVEEPPEPKKKGQAHKKPGV